ncbi:MAG: hypothetical protein ACREP9_21945, partial [Candidatus Dormibacteraceae bacterium]
MTYSPLHGKVNASIRWGGLAAMLALISTMGVTGCTTQQTGIPAANQTGKVPPTNQTHSPSSSSSGIPT